MRIGVGQRDVLILGNQRDSSNRSAPLDRRMSRRRFREATRPTRHQGALARTPSRVRANAIRAASRTSPRPANSGGRVPAPGAKGLTIGSMADCIAKLAGLWKNHKLPKLAINQYACPIVRLTVVPHRHSILLAAATFRLDISAAPALPERLDGFDPLAR